MRFFCLRSIITISLYNFQNTKEEFRSDYALWHGSLMLLAWCFLVPNGIFLSRYFKESFVDVSIFKYRLWFAVYFIICIFKSNESIDLTIKFLTILTRNSNDLHYRATALL